MADTKAGIGYGSVVELADAATPTAYAYVGEVKSITPPSETTDTVDASHMQSPNKTREFIDGMTDPGEFSFDMNLVPGSTSDRLLMAAKGKRKVVRQTFASGHQLIFIGIRSGYEKSVPLDDVMTATVTFKVSGEPTLTEAAAPRNIEAPVIVGVAKVGAPLTVDPGIWAGAMGVTFQWKADATDIVGATGTTFIPLAENIGDVITCEVTGTNDAFDLAAVSAATTAVIA
ncbi:MAG TPA: phage tail tube protein [Devosia sp.]|nr:phage tail tube protein [Devosia sp.]